LSELLDELQIKPTPLKKTKQDIQGNLNMELKVMKIDMVEVKDRAKRLNDCMGLLIRSYRRKPKQDEKRKTLIKFK